MVPLSCCPRHSVKILNINILNWTWHQQVCNWKLAFFSHNVLCHLDETIPSVLICDGEYCVRHWLVGIWMVYMCKLGHAYTWWGLQYLYCLWRKQIFVFLDLKFCSGSWSQKALKNFERNIDSSPCFTCYTYLLRDPVLGPLLHANVQPD